MAGGLFVLPSLFILVALSWIYLAFGHTPLVAGLFHGIKPAVTAIVLHAAHRIGSRALKNSALWAIAAAAFVAIFALHLPFPLIVLAAGVIGAVGGRVAPDRFAMGGGHGAAATVATFFTFLPSFVFILLGGPLVETTHSNLKFTAPLTAITAAVVGVIVNLTLFFAYHVLWPQGFGGGFEVASAVIAVGAALALIRFKRGVMEVIAASAVLGLAVWLVRGGA